MHQVVSLHIGLQSRCEWNCTSIVHQYIDAAKLSFDDESKWKRLKGHSIDKQIPWCASFTLSTALLTAVLTAASSLTSKMHGNALPPSCSTMAFRIIRLDTQKPRDHANRTKLLTLLGCRINGARQLWMGLCCLGCHHDIRSIACCFQRDCLANAARRPSYEYGATS